MPTFPLNYEPGVIADDTVMARGGRYTDADKVRFVRAGADEPAFPEIIGGWERLTLTALTGMARNVHAWRDNAGLLNIAVGTNSKLYVLRGGGVYDITPTLSMPSATLGANPLATTNLSGTIVVTWNGHGLSVNDTPVISGAVDANGITAANINGTRTVTAVTTNTFSFTAGGSQTANATSSGGGSAVVVAPQNAFTAGQVNGTGTQGYSTGGYGVGGYGQPSTADYFPRTWSFGNLGQALIASPRGGAIYEWNNDSATPAAPIANSPRQNTAMLTTPERAVMAIGTNEEVSGVQNPRCIRTSDITNETVWNTDFGTTHEEKVLEGAGRLVSGRVAGFSSFLWTDNEAWQADYIGASDEVYHYTRLGDDCGLIGPNAAAVKGQTAYWWAPDNQFYAASLSGAPATIPCPVREEVRDNLTPSQKDKIVASTLSANNEVWWFYPDARDGLEVSRAIFMNIAEGWWSKAQLVRPAFMDAGPADYPVGVDASGNVYWHERGNTADGGQISWSLTAGPQYVSAGQESLFIRAFQPDFVSGQQGSANLTVLAREKPQSADVTSGPFVVSPGQEKVDLRVEGRIVSWELSGLSGPAQWRMGTPVLEGKVVSRRPK